MERMTIIGIEASEGVGKATGKPYAIGQLHTTIQLAPPFSASGVAKGAIGTTYAANVEAIRRIEHLPLPFVAEVDVQAVSRFGKREQLVVDIRPVEVVKGSSQGNAAAAVK